MADYLVGRADDAYALLRSALCGIYNGATPGGLTCHMFVDGRQRANNEFADAISMWGRAVVEGMYGIQPKRPHGIVQLSPQFPSPWSEASIHTRQFAYQWKRDNGRISVHWESPVAAAIELRLPLQAKRVEQVLVDGKKAAYHLERGVGLTWLTLTSPSAISGTISVDYVPAEITARKPVTWKEGDPVALNCAAQDLDCLDLGDRVILDPQGVLHVPIAGGGTLAGTVVGEPGPHVLFLKSGTDACPFWSPLTVLIEPRQPVAKPIWSPPRVKAKDVGAWTLINLNNLFNANVTDVLGQVAKASRPPRPPALEVNYVYWKDHLLSRVDPGSPSDAAWRKKIGPDQVGWTHDGIPFKSASQGKNIAVVTRAGGFPEKIEVPVGAGGKELYLMLSGMTFPAQSHVVNLRVTLDYAAGSHQPIDLVNPSGIGDCWSTWCGRFHDTAANGFENLGGRFGPPGSSAAGDLTQPIAVDTEAHLLKIALRPGQALRTITLQAVANDVIFGLMGASILK
jgi:hypothetical protein